MDGERFREVFSQYAPRIRGYFLRQGVGLASAEELVQEVMLTVWHRQGGFDPSKGSLATWIFTIARNRLIDNVRRQKRPEPDPADPCWVEGQLDQAISPELAAVRQGRVDSLKRALEKLPREQQSLVEALYFEGKSMSEVAESSGVPLGTVKTRMRRVLQMLREELPARGDA
jgi:RNA polymerase sigma-70 factor (ECF subfamily)